MPTDRTTILILTVLALIMLAICAALAVSIRTAYFQ
jgi:hypothetical protein